MLKLRTVLLCNQPYYFLFFICLIFMIIRLCLPSISHYTEKDKILLGRITNCIVDGNKVTLQVQAKEKVLITYYLKTKQEKEHFIKNYQLGDFLKIKGTFQRPTGNTTENLFNYQQYLFHQQIYYQVIADEITLDRKNKNWYYSWKQKLQEHIKQDPYLKTFILGDKSGLTKDVKTSYQENGISHLFAISGMHITLLSTILLKLLARLKIPEKRRYCLTSIFLIFYLFLTGISASVLRGVLFFLLFSWNKIYYFYIKTSNILLLTLSITLLIQPHFLFDVGFAYSFSISYSLIYLGERLKEQKNYILKLLETSLISFLVSIPISLFHFYQINGLSILYNLFYVPFVSILLFPASLTTTIFPILLPLYQLLTSLLEKSSLWLAKWQPLTWTFPKLPNWIYGFYLMFLLIFLIGYKKRKKFSWLPLTILLISHYMTPNWQKSSYLKMIDVGQGDSILLHSNQCNVLVDTGGKMSFQQEAWKKSKDKSSIVKTTTIPLLKSLGIKKIDYLILTHGDADHMGEAESFLKNFPIQTILLNLGRKNSLEKKVMNQHILTIIGEEGLSFSCGEFNFYQLNKEFPDENDSSQVYLVKYQRNRILLMGDASKKTEEYLLSQYDLQDITILKIGHHGSRTSSSKSFIDETNPMISLISVGKDNKFSHPHKEVIEILEKNQTNIYQTSISGTITFDFHEQTLEEEIKTSKK